jgi:hypothetical protein
MRTHPLGASGIGFVTVLASQDSRDERLGRFPNLPFTQTKPKCVSSQKGNSFKKTLFGAQSRIAQCGTIRGPQEQG